MITRGKSSLRGGNLSTAVVSEPFPFLHFLYPRWASSGLVLSRFNSVIASRRPKSREISSSSGSLPLPHCRLIDSTRPACRWLSHEAAPSVNDRFNVDTAGGRDAHTASGSTSNDARSVDDSEADKRLGESSPGQGSHQTRLGPQYDEQFEGEYGHTGLTDDVRVRRVRRDMQTAKRTPVDFKLEAAERIQALRYSSNRTRKTGKKLKYRQHVLAWRQLKHRKSKYPPHWTDIMAMLERMQTEMPVTSEDLKSKEILVREEVIVQLSGDASLSENMWYIDIRNGCRVRVLDSIESEGIYRKMIISGTSRAIELVEKKIRDVTKRQLMERASRNRSSLPIIPSLRAFVKTGRPIPLIRAYFDEEIIPTTLARPPWDVRSFAVSVEQLVISPTLERTDGHNPLPHNEVAKLLQDHFKKPTHLGFISTYALNLALKFLLRYEYLESARIIFRASQHVATADTYNLFLMSNAKRQDPFFSHYLLVDMEKTGVQPNGQTWFAFLESLLSPGPRLQVIRRMRELGLLNDRKLEHAVIRSNIGPILFPHLEKGLNIESFFESLEKSYGSGIIDVDTLNAVLEQLLTKRETNQANLIELLWCFRNFDITPNSRTLTMVFSFFDRLEYAATALLWFINACEDLLTARHFNQMFRAAIRSNMYNTCRVIWRYACLKQFTTWQMRDIVWRSLSGRNTSRAKDPDQLESHLGAIVVGLEYQADVKAYGAARNMVPPEHASNPIAYMLEHIVAEAEKPKKKSAIDRANLATQLLTDDVKQGPKRQSVLPFGVMLEAAIEMDKMARWHSHDPEYPAMNRRSTLDILPEVIKVPIDACITD